VCTFHNLGLNIIRKEHARLGYKPGFSIFDESDVKALMTDIMQKEYSGDDGVDEIKNMIGAWKNDLILPPEPWKTRATRANRPPPSSTPTTSARSRRSTRWTSTT
jgi:superfamily I DNA/RNA helicase